MSHFDISLSCSLSCSVSSDSDDSQLINNYSDKDDGLISTDDTDMMFEYLANNAKLKKVITYEPFDTDHQNSQTYYDSTDTLYKCIDKKNKIKDILTSQSFDNKKSKNDYKNFQKSKDIFISTCSSKKSKNNKYIIIDDTNTTDDILAGIALDVGGLQYSVHIDKTQKVLHPIGQVHKINNIIQSLSSIRNKILESISDDADSSEIITTSENIEKILK